MSGHVHGCLQDAPSCKNRNSVPTKHEVRLPTPPAPGSHLRFLPVNLTASGGSVGRAEPSDYTFWGSVQESWGPQSSAENITGWQRTRSSPKAGCASHIPMRTQLVAFPSTILKKKKITLLDFQNYKSNTRLSYHGGVF